MPNIADNGNKTLAVPTEVYSRIVGYYRPVQNWNIGKFQEFSERNIYDRKLKTF